MRTNKFKEVITMILLCTAWLSSQTSEAVRTPAVAGMFYPEDPQVLTKMIDEFLAKTKKVISGEIGGLVSPHAGYVYSGPVAAWSYRQIMGETYDVVVVISPSHFEYFPGSSVYPGKFYETPLGKIEVEEELARKLVDLSSTVQLSDKGHRVGFTGRGEHALEVQLPFLQKVLGDFFLIPIVMADQSLPNVEDLARALAKTLKGKKALIVASSDLSHYHSYSTAYELDSGLLELFRSFNYREIVEKCQSQQLEACGYGPIAAMMLTCSKLGYTKSEVIKYATSGDVPVGEKSQVVGYMSGVVYR